MSDSILTILSSSLKETQNFDVRYDGGALHDIDRERSDRGLQLSICDFVELSFGN